MRLMCLFSQKSTEPFLFAYIVTMTFKYVNKHDLNRQDQDDKSDKLVEEVWQWKRFPNTTSRVLINYKLSRSERVENFRQRRSRINMKLCDWNATQWSLP